MKTGRCQAEQRKIYSLIIFTLSQSEADEPEETFSTDKQMTETELETQKPASPPPQDQDKVAEFCRIFLSCTYLDF